MGRSRESLCDSETRSELIICLKEVYDDTVKDHDSLYPRCNDIIVPVLNAIVDVDDFVSAVRELLTYCRFLHTR